MESAINDAQKISKILEENYGFNVTLNLDANNQTILSTLNSYRNRLTENDHLLIFYSGHSWLNTNDGKGYWFPIDADDTKLNTWIDIDFITTILKDMDAKHVLILADSCYSGTIKRESNLNTSNNDYFKRMAKKRARSVISSGSFEPVLELTHQEGFSVFANAIIQSFLENDGILSATELFRQIRQPMLEKSNQTPVYADIYNAGHGGGDFLFVKTK